MPVDEADGRGGGRGWTRSRIRDSPRAWRGGGQCEEDGEGERIRIISAVDLTLGRLGGWKLGFYLKILVNW